VLAVLNAVFSELLLNNTWFCRQTVCNWTWSWAWGVRTGYNTGRVGSEGVVQLLYLEGTIFMLVTLAFWRNMLLSFLRLSGPLDYSVTCCCFFCWYSLLIVGLKF
jgi:hypothetical protein